MPLSRPLRFPVRQILPLTLAACGFLCATAPVRAVDGTWTDANSATNNNYSNASNWSSGTIATGTGATASIGAFGTMILDENVTLGNFTETLASGASFTVSGSSSSNVLTFATSSGTPLINLTSFYSRYDYFGNFSLAGTKGISWETGSNISVFQTGLSWTGFTGTLTVLNHGNDAGQIYAQGTNVLPNGADFTLTPGNETNGYGNAKLIINGGTTQTIGALASAVGTSSCNAYVSSYVASDLQSSAPGGTNNTGSATLIIGNTNDSATFNGIIGTSYSFQSNKADATANQLNLIKVGTGSETLAGADNYVGTTTINGGQLLLTGSHTGGGQYTVNSGGTLAGSGTLTPTFSATGGAIDVKSGGTLSSGISGSTGTLTLNQATTTTTLVNLEAGANLAFKLNSGTASDQLSLANNLAGAISFNGNLINFTDMTSGSTLAAGQYTLIRGAVAGSYSGLTTNANGYITGGLAIGTGLSSYSGSSLQVVGNNIVLNLAANTSVSGTWTDANSAVDNNYSDTANWSSGAVASGVGSVATINASGSVVLNQNVTLGILATNYKNGASFKLSGNPATSSLSFATTGATPSVNLTDFYSRLDYFGNFNLAGNQGLTWQTGSNVSVLQSGLTWTGFVGTFSLLNHNTDGAQIYAQGNNVLPNTGDVAMTPGNETNGYGNTKLIINGGTSQTIGALTSVAGGSSGQAYVSSYVAADISNGTPSGTNTVATATLTLGNTGDTGTFNGVIGTGFNNSSNTPDASANLLSLVKAGTGTETLAGADNYAGTTTVNGGVLSISGSHAGGGQYIINSGGTLAGSGTITPIFSSSGGAIDVKSGGLVAPGPASVTGTLSLNQVSTTSTLLNLESGAGLKFKLNSSAASDCVALSNASTSAVVFGGNVVNFTDLTSGSLTAGQYVLFTSGTANSYSGLTVDGNGFITAGLTIGSGLSNYSGSTLQVVGNSIVLNLAVSLAPGTPTGLTTTTSGTQVTVSWTAGSNATGYNIYRSTSPTGPFAKVGSSSTTSYVDTSAVNGQTYYYEVTTTNNLGESSPSAATAVTPLNPSTISIMSVHLRAYSTYGMAVTDTAGVDRVGYWNNLLGPSLPGEVETLGTVTDHLGNALSGVTVSWTTGSTGTSSYTNCGTIKLGSDAVTVPPATNDLNLYASAFDQTNGTPSTLTVSGIPYSSYDVIFYTNDAGSTQGGTITANGSTLALRGGIGNPTVTGTGYVQSTDSTHTSGTNVQQGNYVRFFGLTGTLTASLVATNVGSSTQNLEITGFQVISDAAVPPPSTVPAAPTGLSTVSGNQAVGLNWAASATATSYKIYRNGSLLGSVSAPLLSYADTAVTNGTTYSYTVSAVNSVGEGQQTSPATASPVEPSFTAPSRTVYQYSVQLTGFFPSQAGTYWPADPQRRAYLWIPPGCQKIQGVVIGLHNMLERPMFDDPTIRQACTNANLALLLVAPGDAKVWTPSGVGNYGTGAATTAIDLDPNEYVSKDISSSTGTNYPTDVNTAADDNTPVGQRFANQAEQCGAEIVELLDQFASVSGYSELKYAPVMITGHSAASTFVWTRGVPASAALTGRVFAIMPYKGTYPGNISNYAGIPIMHVSSEWQEISDWGNTWELGDATALRGLRSGGTNDLIGECVQPGTGHYEYSPAQAAPLADFIQAVATTRIPANWPATTYPALMPETVNSGWVIDTRFFGSGNCQAVAYNTWVSAGNDPLRAYWYPDEATAQAVCACANAGFAKAPQMINAFQNSTTLAPLASQASGVGYVNLSATLQSDGLTFQVRAAPVNQSPVARLYNSGALGMASGPILFRANGSGSMKQVGPDTFQVYLDRDSVTKGGQPWEPFILAYQPGDTNYRSAYRPIYITTSVPVNNNNTSYATQSINSSWSSSLPDVDVASFSNITLSGSTAATASSGLPIQYWVVSGPYKNDPINSNILLADTIPVRVKYPMQVTIGAWQWGSPNSKIQAATPIYATFNITATSLEQWRLANFGTAGNTGNAADSANPSGDGISNLMKYATGMSPSTYSSTAPAAVDTSANDSNLTITFNRIADPSLTYIVEAANSLTGTWSSIWSSTGSANVAGSVTVPDTVPMSSQTKRFLRLRVEY